MSATEMNQDRPLNMLIEKGANIEAENKKGRTAISFAAAPSLDDFLLLMLRDKVDIITGDFNQGAYVLGEVMSEVVSFYFRDMNEVLEWHMPPPHEEIRTIIINWPTFPNSTLTGRPVMLKLSIKQQSHFESHNVEDYGLKVSDTDSHTPSFYMIRKGSLTHADLHQRSAEGKRKDDERRKRKKRKKKAEEKEKKRRTDKGYTLDDWGCLQP